MVVSIMWCGAIGRPALFGRTPLVGMHPRVVLSPCDIDEIKANISALGGDVDVVIVEIGGTVGDIESLPFLEAIRQFRQEIGRDNGLFVHITLVPYIRAAREMKERVGDVPLVIWVNEDQFEYHLYRNSLPGGVFYVVNSNKNVDQVNRLMEKVRKYWIL